MLKYKFPCLCHGKSYFYSFSSLSLSVHSFLFHSARATRISASVHRLPRVTAVTVVFTTNPAFHLTRHLTAKPVSCAVISIRTPLACLLTLFNGGLKSNAHRA